MNREMAYKLVKKQVKNKNLVKHMLAVEAVMEKLASHLGEDRDLWGLAGLVHDIDYDQTVSTPEKHGLVGAEILEKEGMPSVLIQAVKAHNEILGYPCQSLLDKALYATDPLTGLIVAAALIHPKKKLAAIDVKFVLNRFREKQFARGARREQICSCEEIGLSLEEFLEIGLTAMQERSTRLGL